MISYWFGNFRSLPSKDAEIIETLSKKLVEAQKMRDLWKKAYEELDEMVRELANKVITLEKPNRK